ncbi:hypothetical protein G6F23_014375 [Rhizopus arrhizus]|nr:hypothetical protein G6F23_014375 [Rhizopus arrhizus]
MAKPWRCGCAAAGAARSTWTRPPVPSKAGARAVPGQHRQGHSGLGGAGLPVPAHHRAEPVVAAALGQGLEHRTGPRPVAVAIRPASGGRGHAGPADRGIGRHRRLHGVASAGRGRNVANR